MIYTKITERYGMESVAGHLEGQQDRSGIKNYTSLHFSLGIIREK